VRACGSAGCRRAGEMNYEKFLSEVQALVIVTRQAAGRERDLDMATYLLGLADDLEQWARAQDRALCSPQ
jgi:hypothetical protein